MNPARRQTLEEGLAIIRDVNDADAWELLTTETRTALIKLGATFGETPELSGDAGDDASDPYLDQVHFMKLEGVSALCGFDNGEHLLLRWAANARTALAEGDDVSRGEAE
jgi:hypothetical protein